MTERYFHKHGILSNIPTIIEEFPDEQQMIPIDSGGDMKVLGINWNQKALVSHYYEWKRKKTTSKKK